MLYGTSLLDDQFMPLVIYIELTLNAQIRKLLINVANSVHFGIEET